MDKIIIKVKNKSQQKQRSYGEVRDLRMVKDNEILKIRLVEKIKPTFHLLSPDLTLSVRLL
jgi:hypothetical protein